MVEYTVAELAVRLKVTTKTVRNWLTTGCPGQLGPRQVAGGRKGRIWSAFLDGLKAGKK